MPEFLENNCLFTGTVPEMKQLIYSKYFVDHSLFAGTVPANNSILSTNKLRLRGNLWTSCRIC